MINFKHKNIADVKKYFWLKEERNQFQGIGNENFIEGLLEVKKLEDFASMPCFSVTLSNYKQSNTDGMFLLVGELHELRNKIVFTLDENGRLGKVRNLPEIQNKWKEIKTRINKSFYNQNPYADNILNKIGKLLLDNEKFSETLRFSSPYITLFPGIHNNKNSQEAEFVVGYRELPNFLAAPKVPIITNEKIIKEDKGEYELQIKGSIDTEKFEQHKLTAMIRLIKNRPRVPAQLNLKYEERILLDDDHWLQQNVCMSLAYVPGTLYREEKAIVRAV